MIFHGDPWPAVVDVMYAPGLLYKPKPEDAQRFADLAEAGYIGAVEGPHGGFAGYALRSMGMGMRRDIANAAGITNMRLVTLALGRLETFGFVDQRNDRLWKCTAEGFGLFDEAHAAESQSPETPAIPEPEALSSQAIMQTELQRLLTSSPP